MGSELTATAERPASTVEIDDSSFQLLPSVWLKDPGGHAAQRGVHHVHGGRGAGLYHLHPGHHVVQDVDAVTHAQSVSDVALQTRKETTTLKLEFYHLLVMTGRQPEQRGRVGPENTVQGGRL